MSENLNLRLKVSQKLVADLTKENKKLQSQLARYEETLLWYGDGSNWEAFLMPSGEFTAETEKDRGERAREALKENKTTNNRG